MGGEDQSEAEIRYKAYIDCINNSTMTTELEKYCKSTVIHNDRSLSLDQYRELIQEAKDAIPDIHFHIDKLVADERKGVIAAILTFTGTPIKPLEGLESNGKSVRFSEHVFYQLSDGKIEQVWSLIDWNTAARQLEE